MLNAISVDDYARLLLRSVHLPFLPMTVLLAMLFTTASRSVIQTRLPLQAVHNFHTVTCRCFHAAAR
jgi:hypothetical protein